MHFSLKGETITAPAKHKLLCSFVNFWILHEPNTMVKPDESYSSHNSFNCYSVTVTAIQHHLHFMKKVNDCPEIHQPHILRNAIRYVRLLSKNRVLGRKTVRTFMEILSLHFVTSSEQIVFKHYDLIWQN